MENKKEYYYQFLSLDNFPQKWKLKGCMEKGPKCHLIDSKILLANCFSLPWTEEENLTWDQESLWAFFHKPLSMYLPNGRVIDDLYSAETFHSRTGEQTSAN